MVHRALLAAGPPLRLHEPLLGIVHRELFPAMAAAVRGNAGGGARIWRALRGSGWFVDACSQLLCPLASEPDTPQPQPHQASYQTKSNPQPQPQARTPSLGVINGICQVLLAVWQVSDSELKCLMF